MKTKNMIVILLLALIGCEVKPPINTTEKLSRLTPPVIVVGTGTTLGDCCVMVVDANGIFEQVKTNSLCTVSKGDTLIKALN